MSSGRLRHVWTEWVRPFLVLVFVVGSFRSAVADWNDVPTGSMRPTILEGDRIVVDRRAFALRVPFTSIELAEYGTPERGDIIVFPSPADGTRLVKRVVAVAGDTIELRNNLLVIDGHPVVLGERTRQAEDPPGNREDTTVTTETLPGAPPHAVLFDQGTRSLRDFQPIEVPAGHVFTMGDNRDHSLDSRWFGFVDVDTILGRAVAIGLSVDPERHYRPRWSRFGQGLD